MSPRRDEGSERMGALVLTVVLVLSFWGARRGVAETHAVLDHRERLLAAREPSIGLGTNGGEAPLDIGTMFVDAGGGARPAPLAEVR